MKEEIRKTTREKKNTETGIKQIAMWKIQAEKKRNTKMKTNCHIKSYPWVPNYIADIKISNSGAKKTFQVELEKVKDKFQQVELQSVTLENEIK